MEKQRSSWFLVVAIILSGIIVALTLFGSNKNDDSPKENKDIETADNETGDSFQNWLNDAKNTPKVQTTDDISKVLISEYLNSKDIGNLSDQEMQKIVSDTVNSFSIKTEKHTIADITISNKTDNQTMHNYGNQLAGLFLSPQKLDQNEIEIVFDALEKDDQTILKNLKPIKEGYSKIVAGLQQIEVPEQLTETHLQILDISSEIKNALDSFSLVFDDPVPALYYISSYSDIAKKLRESISETGQILSNNDVTFTQNENGYILISEI
jgi:hypothetical protein